MDKIQDRQFQAPDNIPGSPALRGVIHEYDEAGRHRLRFDQFIGEWERYEFPCTLDDPRTQTQYVGWTDYFDEKVTVSTIPAEVAYTTRQVCKICGIPFEMKPQGEITGDETSIFTKACLHLLEDERRTRAMMADFFKSQES